MEKRYCSLCLSCINDCKRVSNIKECENFSLGTTLSEFKDEIRNQNVNLKRLCKENGLKYWVLMQMLNGKREFTYKYRMILEGRLTEKEEYLPYLEEGDTI